MTDKFVTFWSYREEPGGQEIPTAGNYAILKGRKEPVHYVIETEGETYEASRDGSLIKDHRYRSKLVPIVTARKPEIIERGLLVNAFGRNPVRPWGRMRNLSGSAPRKNFV